MNLDKLNNRTKTYHGSGKGIRVILYSHDTLGLGHIKRNLKIARALKTSFPEISILFITGSLKGPHFDLPPGTDFVKLPSVKKTGVDQYDSRFSDVSFEQTLSLRKAIIQDVVKEYIPHFFLADHSPLGMNGELLPALEWLAGHNDKCVKILGLRDIIDEPEKVKESWSNSGVYELLEKLYDLILIYGSSDIFDPVQNYGMNQKIEAKTRYVGYIAEMDNNRRMEKQDLLIPKNGKKLVLITIGGGEWMAGALIGNFLEALETSQSTIDYDSLILTGPFIPDELWSDYHDKCRSLPTKLLRFVPETRPYIESSDLVLATGGYNTITDLLSYGGKALIIPRIQYRQEQLLRAARLSDLGLFEYIHPDSISPDFLIEKIAAAIEDDKKPLMEARKGKKVNLDGAINLVKIIGNLIPEKV